MLTSKNNLKALYSANQKIIIAHSEVAKLNYFNQITEILTEIKFYEYRTTEQGEVILPLNQESEDDLVEINLAPTFVLGFLVNSDIAKQELHSLQQWWQEKCPQEQIPPELALTEQENFEVLKSEFWQLLFRRVSKDYTTMAQRLTDLQRQYSQLRQLYENTQNAFSVVENFLSQAQLPPTQLAFENAPSREMVTPNPSENLYQIKQLLPLPGAGLATIELYISKFYLHSTGQLNVSLNQLDDDTCLAQWSVQYENLRQGLLSLDLPHVSIMPKNDVVLVIEWITNIGPAPCLSLGELQSVPQFRTFANGSDFPRSLALRLWTGLPGSRKVFSPYSVSPPVNQKLGMYGYLGNAVLSHLLEITPNLPTDSFAHIQVDKEHNKILIHPRDQGLTIAMLPFCFPPGATHLTATVCTENEQANLLEYGLALIEEGMNPKTCFEEQIPNSHLSFSGWISVNPLEQRHIKLSTQPSDTKFYHIVIATKVPPGSSSNLGWAYWLNFFIESKPSV